MPGNPAPKVAELSCFSRDQQNRSRLTIVAGGKMHEFIFDAHKLATLLSEAAREMVRDEPRIRPNVRA
jgi:hypothetical protein